MIVWKFWVFMWSCYRQRAGPAPPPSWCPRPSRPSWPTLAGAPLAQEDGQWSVVCGQKLEVSSQWPERGPPLLPLFPLEVVVEVHHPRLIARPPRGLGVPDLHQLLFQLLDLCLVLPKLPDGAPAGGDSSAATIASTTILLQVNKILKCGFSSQFSSPLCSLALCSSALGALTSDCLLNAQCKMKRNLSPASPPSSSSSSITSLTNLRLTWVRNSMKKGRFRFLLNW